MGAKTWIGLGLGLAALGGAAVYAQFRDTEQPDYLSLQKDGDFELREYAPMIVAEVTHTGPRRNAQGASFQRLAAYIFAQDRPAGGEAIAMTAPVITNRVNQSEKIAMTAPVMTEQTARDEWRMRFVMPAKYSMDTLPTPPSDITLTELPGRRMAAVKFSGTATDSDLIIMEARLTEWLEQQKLTPAGEFEYAFYNAPMVPGPLRRNEVLVEVAAE